MILTKSRKYTVNMGNYNSFSFEATVSLDSEKDLGVSEATDETFSQLLDWTDQLLVESLQDEIRQAGFSETKTAMLALLANQRKENQIA